MHHQVGAVDAVVTGAPAQGPLGRVRGLDGIRAVAVLVVVCVHAGMGGLVAGYLGVDMFFVLSGFLITHLLVREARTNGHIRFRHFYVRRFSRLYPPLLAMLLLGGLAASRLAFDGDPLSYMRSAVFAATYTMNYAIAGHVDPGNAIGVTWSLAVEEHFYLVWPVALTLLLAMRSRARRLLAVVALYFISFALCQFLYRPAHGRQIQLVYFHTETRAGSLFIGCALALLFCDFPSLWARTSASRALRLLGGCAPSLLVAELLVLPHVDEGRWKYLTDIPIVGVLTAALIAVVVAQPEALIARALSSGPLGVVGRASYSVYLWQYVIWTIVPVHPFGLHYRWAVLMRVGLTIAVVGASYLILERPRLRSKSAGSYPRTGRMTSALSWRLRLRSPT